jgi:hypothetical protein
MQEATNTYRELLRNEKLSDFTKPSKRASASTLWARDDDNPPIALTHLVIRTAFALPARARNRNRPSVQAQSILLKTGQTIETKGVRRSGDMVMIKVQVGASSGEVGYHASTIAKIAFPEPLQLKTTAVFLSQGQPEKALADIEPIVKYYEHFRDIPGNWWAPAALLKLSALSGCSSIRRPRGWVTKSEKT